MKKILLLVPLVILLGCTPIERTAYNTVVSAKAFLDSVKSTHPECTPGTSTLCIDLRKATAAKDVIIDAGIAYCQGPGFQNGGACQPPNKNSPAYQQLFDKLTASLTSYSQAEKDLKGVIN